MYPVDPGQLCKTCPWFVPRPALSLSLSLSGNQIAALSQMSWLMKTAAIELRMTSLNRQRSHTQRLVSLLLDDQPPTQHTGTPPRTLPRAHTAH